MTNNPRYTLGTEANRIFMASETYELLKFGKGFPAPDGGSGWLNADGTLDPSHGVETWITSRMAHVYSIGAMLGYPGAGELANFRMVPNVSSRLKLSGPGRSLVNSTGGTDGLTVVCRAVPALAMVLVIERFGAFMCPTIRIVCARALPDRRKRWISG